jgi:hypothetical protein
MMDAKERSRLAGEIFLAIRKEYARKDTKASHRPERGKPPLVLRRLEIPEPVHLVILRRERARAVLHGREVPLSHFNRPELSVRREYVALQVDSQQTVALSFTSPWPCGRLAGLLNGYLEWPVTHPDESMRSAPCFAHLFTMSDTSVKWEGWASEELFRKAKATCEAIAGRRLVVEGGSLREDRHFTGVVSGMSGRGKTRVVGPVAWEAKPRFQDPREEENEIVNTLRAFGASGF